MLSAADQFTRLVDIIITLRGPDGCPWDREQTIHTLRKYLLEETYEVLSAIDHQDHESLLEELGDFILQAIFLSQLEDEAGHFSIADVLKAIADKLVRRHPHVFRRESGEPALDTASQVRTLWEEIKTEERGGVTAVKTLLSGIPPALPSLLRAHQIGSRAASAGFEWERATDVIAKIREEIDEVEEVIDSHETHAAERLEEEVGDLLFAVANLSRKLGIEPESALRKANDKFTDRFTRMETTIASSDRRMADMSLKELELEWERVKRGAQAG